MELKLLAVHTDRWTVGPLAGQTNNNYLNAQHGGAVLRENTVSPPHALIAVARMRG